MRKIHQDIWVGISLLAVVGIMFFNSLELGRVSPDSVVMPRIAMAIIAVFGIMIMVDGVRKTRAAAAKGELPKQYFTAKEMKVPAISFAIITAYIVTFYFVGYMVATPIFMLGFMYYLKMRNWKHMIAITAVFMIIVYVFFVMVLGIRLDNFGAIQTWLMA